MTPPHPPAHEIHMPPRRPSAARRRRPGLTRRFGELCAESAMPVLTAQGRGLESLERVAAASPVQEVVLWGYLEAGSVRGVHRAAGALTAGKGVVYLACDRLDGG